VLVEYGMVWCLCLAGSTLTERNRSLDEVNTKLERKTNELYQANALSRASVQEKEAAQRSADMKQQEVDRLRGRHSEAFFTSLTLSQLIIRYSPTVMQRSWKTGLRSCRKRQIDSLKSSDSSRKTSLPQCPFE
jgi:predicted RNase H-like nuclease (RuvC/YqgF family)